MKKIALLLGGFSKEREVSLRSGNSTYKALLELGYNVVKIDADNDLKTLVDTLKEEKPDVAFNCLHGTMGEDGNIQAVLNYLKIPYTNSGVLASSIAMDKWKSYQLFLANNVKTPFTWLLDTQKKQKCPTDFPCIVKPINEGSSVGVKLVKNENEWEQVLNSWCHGDFAVVQNYLKGREINVAVFNSNPIGTIEINPIGHEIFDYVSKYTPGHLETICPAALSESDEKLALETAEKAYKALGCRCLARVDMLFLDGNFFVLEVNTQPGFTSESLAPKIAASKGIPFIKLVDNMINSARCD